jgi:lipoprotein-releasing system permease protein
VYKLLLCWRYLRTRYLAMVCIVSVMLGVATLIVVNSVMAGFSTKLQDRLRGLTSDLEIESIAFSGIDSPEEKMERIRSNPTLSQHIEAMAPTMEIFAMLQFDLGGETVLRPVRLIGIDPKRRAELGGFREHLVDPANRDNPSFELRGEARERWLRLQQFKAQPRVHVPPPGDGDLPPPAPPETEPYVPKGIIVGHAIAHIRNKSLTPGSDQDRDTAVLHRGDEVILTTIGGVRLEPKSFRCAVVDYVKTEMSEYDANTVYMSLEDLQHIRTMHDRSTAIQVKLKDYARSKDEVKQALQEMFPAYHVSTWEDKQGPLLAAISIEKGILNILLFLIIGVAGFGILAIFSMIVVEKTRDIGILKALGASNGGVMRIFLGYGLLLGLVGAALGTVLGISFTVYINEIEVVLAKVTGQEIFDRSVYYFDKIPTDIQSRTVFLLNLGAVGIAVLFSVLPALRAALLHPVRALRYE